MKHFISETNSDRRQENYAFDSRDFFYRIVSLEGGYEFFFHIINYYSSKSEVSLALHARLDNCAVPFHFANF